MSVLISDPPPRLEAVPFTAVTMEDRFWAPRLQTSLEVTIPYCFGRCQETGRIANFARAAGLEEGPFQGIYFDDSDVYKVIEGAAYALSIRREPGLESFLDGLIEKIAAAQQPDGYLNTYHTLVAPAKRWTDIRTMHELYCAGHLFEAAVAHHRSTGKRGLLDVALRLADHIDATFGPGRNPHPPGHEEIEIGLVKLFDLTGERRYLDLAKFFIDQRGRAEGRELYGAYAQDHVPVIEQTAPVGHAVRAMYLYCGMADVAARTGESSYLTALDRIWTDMITTKLYLTGGIGARRQGEAFGDAYELPNKSAYCETCAAIGNALWNHRMNLLQRDARYADVLERVLYNGLISGVSLSGDRFFYPNPLASSGGYHRSPWFDCACCPVNVARFVPSIGGYVYARAANAIYVNLYANGRAQIELGGGSVSIEQETEYPWEGRVTLVLRPQPEAEFDLCLRLPGWATGDPVPSDLYRNVDRGRPLTPPRLSVNGAAMALEPLDRGYVRLRRRWTDGDRVQLDLPMAVRLVKAHDSVEADRGRVAIERGPIVYCIEGADLDEQRLRDLWIKPDSAFSVEHRPDVLGGVTVVTTEAHVPQRSAERQRATDVIPLAAIPYAVWDHRADGEMAVWIPADPSLIRVAGTSIAATSRASASHCYEHDSIGAVNDQDEPDDSGDHAISRLTWWDHRGTSEWVQYDFAEPAMVQAVAVYWFDDSGVGRCRVPRSWRLLYREGERWLPVKTTAEPGVARDRYNRVEFEPLRTDGLRLEVQLQDEYSGGILEWTVE